MNYILKSLVIVLIFLTSCADKTAINAFINKEIITHALANPTTLNPQCHTSQLADQMVNLMFQPLLQIDIYDGSIRPVLAKSRPILKVNEEGQYEYYFELRPNAQWDDGKSITASDVVFSLKSMFNPHCNNGVRRQHLEQIDRIVIDTLDNKKFKLIYNEPYNQVEWSLMALYIIDERKIDPNAVLAAYDFEKIKAYSLDYKTKVDWKLKKYAKQFNSMEYQTSDSILLGSGPYIMEQWDANQFVSFKKKENWWGEEEAEEHLFFRANASKIHFEIIKDWNLTLSTIEQGQLDIVNSVPMDDFLKMQSNPKLSSIYDFESPSNFVYEYITFNTLDPVLSNRKLRKYIATLIDKSLMVDKVLHGFGSPIHSMIHPSKSYYNDTLITSLEKDIKLDPNKPLRILYNAGNKRREKIVHIIADAIKQAGGDAVIESWDWKVFLEKRKARDFQLLISASGQSPAPEVLNQTWHTSSIASGRNFSGFGNHRSDMLIDSINLELDEMKRGEMYKRFQAYVHQEQPYVFLYTLNQRIIKKKAYSEIKTSSIRPNYWLGDF